MDAESNKVESSWKNVRVQPEATRELELWNAKLKVPFAELVTQCIFIVRALAKGEDPPVFFKLITGIYGEEAKELKVSDSSLLHDSAVPYEDKDDETISEKIKRLEAMMGKLVNERTPHPEDVPFIQKRCPVKRLTDALRSRNYQKIRSAIGEDPSIEIMGDDDGLEKHIWRWADFSDLVVKSWDGFKTIDFEFRQPGPPLRVMRTSDLKVPDAALDMRFEARNIPADKGPLKKAAPSDHDEEAFLREVSRVDERVRKAGSTKHKKKAG